MGDFQVGLGRVLLRPGEVFLGIVLDISYKPVSDHRLAEPMIRVRGVQNKVQGRYLPTLCVVSELCAAKKCSSLIQPPIPGHRS